MMRLIGVRSGHLCQRCQTVLSPAPGEEARYLKEHDGALNVELKFATSTSAQDLQHAVAEGCFICYRVLRTLENSFHKGAVLTDPGPVYLDYHYQYHGQYYEAPRLSVTSPDFLVNFGLYFEFTKIISNCNVSRAFLQIVLIASCSYRHI